MIINILSTDWSRYMWILVQLYWRTV